MTALVEDHTALDVRDLHRAGLIPNAHRCGVAVDGGEWDWCAPVTLRNGPGTWVAVHLDLEVGQGELLVEDPQRAAVAMVSTRQPLGGRRFWLECPRCRERAGVLFEVGGWRCRRCAGLVYETQVVDDAWRRLLVARRRVARQAVRAGVTDVLYGPPTFSRAFTRREAIQPPYRWRRTWLRDLDRYDELVRREAAATAQLVSAMEAGWAVDGRATASPPARPMGPVSTSAGARA